MLFAITSPELVEVLYPFYLCSVCFLSLMRNDMFTTFLQQILSSRLLLVVMGGQKNNLSCEFKLESITT